MWLLRLAWKNLWRNKTRTAVSMSAVFFAVVLSVFTGSLKDGVFENLIRNVVGFYTGYIQVYARGYSNEQVLDNSLAYSENLGRKIREIAGVSDATPRLETYGLATAGRATKGCLITGVDPERENRATSLGKKVYQGRYLRPDDRAVLLSEGLAARIGAGLNDTIFLIGQGYHGSTAAGRFPVCGLVRFGSPALNNQMVCLSMPAAGELLDATGRATSVVVSISDPSSLYGPVQAISRKLGKDYEVKSWEEILPGIRQHIETDSNQMRYVQGILYMLVSFGIFSTMLMMMAERRFELGMLVAIGMGKGKLCLLMAAESVFTVLGGCLLGLACSVPLVYYFNRMPLRLGGEVASVYEKFGFEAVFPTSLAPENFVVQGLTVLVIGMLLSLYPIYRVLKINPSESIRR
jgi:putative ABC transport system permease protein